VPSRKLGRVPHTRYFLCILASPSPKRRYRGHYGGFPMGMDVSPNIVGIANIANSQDRSASRINVGWMGCW
jgi:hypothetical protein